MTSAPDISFIQSIRKHSHAPLKQCMQCGYCSVVCDLSPEDHPFPRKEMIWASWGQKEKLVSDPDIWLCHQCGDCSAYCPRGVKPGDLMAALRRESMLYYARPRFLARWLSKPWFLAAALVIPLAIIYLVLTLSGTLHIPDGPVNYSLFLPHEYLNTVFGLLFFLAAAVGLMGVSQFLKEMKAQFPYRKKTKKSRFLKLIRAKFEILSHRKFKSCSSHRYRFYSHFLVFWGFILLLIVTLFAILSVLFFEYPIPLWNPIKITGNVASLMLITGLSIMIWQRLFYRDKIGYTGYFDWVFLVAFYFLTLSGIFVEVSRFADWHLGYYLYALHLALVWFIILYAPYTKFAHILYRTIVIAYNQ